MTQPSHSDIAHSLGKLEGRMAALESRVGEGNRATVAAITKIEEQITTRFDRHTERIRVIEGEQAELNGRIKGGVRVLGIGLPVVGGIITAIYHFFRGGAGA